MTDFKRGDMVEVQWVDAMTHSPWTDEADTMIGLLVKTVGHYINQDKHYFRTAASYCEGMGAYGDVAVIPLASVVKARRLK